ncbi:hypothetical protein RRG08_059813 [Elysia crispata]|uniref:Counting factor associated protein D n=1 Tax=Elysia crispata TaxID=231223 RepID=A0AAE1BDL1_9GAST|nr:hypothetical protein RRG08_059813 [Elysia crispata]
MATFVGTLTFLCLFGISLCIDPPVYSKTYRATGTIRLPYAEIVEPFKAFYDAGTQRSRVDYYNGIQSTILLGPKSSPPYGASFLVVPVSTQTVMNKVSCFKVNGSKEMPIENTDILPDLTGFKFVGVEVISNMKANTFQLVNTEGKKVNTYTFWASAEDNRPMRYEMMGYDSLIGSHYDKYYVDYESFVAPAVFTDKDFSVPAGMSCGDFPGPGQSHHQAVEMEPIKEFVHHYDAHVDDSFETFKKVHKKDYKPHEHEPRKHIFRQNLRYINSKNRAGLSYKMSVNHLAAHTDKEMKLMRGFRYTHGDRGGKTFSSDMLKNTDAPDQWDWRLIGAVTPVKDQAICGSCWSFGTTGTIEGANFLKTGKLVRLSQQELVDCSWGFGNNGCDGGEDFRAYKYMMANGGLTSEELYRPYQAIDSTCLKDKAQNVVQISNYTILPQGDLNSLKLAVYEKGPISVAIDASHKSLSFYANGVYYEPECKSDPDHLDHAVLAVGYGTLNGQKYWLVKNSWSTYWGNSGYVLMSQKDNNCGVATAASFVQIK